jgi:hypothetical protein
MSTSNDEGQRTGGNCPLLSRALIFPHNYINESTSTKPKVPFLNGAQVGFNCERGPFLETRVQRWRQRFGSGNLGARQRSITVHGQASSSWSSRVVVVVVVRARPCEASQFAARRGRHGSIALVDLRHRCAPRAAVNEYTKTDSEMERKEKVREESFRAERLSVRI